MGTADVRKSDKKHVLYSLLDSFILGVYPFTKELNHKKKSNFKQKVQELTYFLTIKNKIKYSETLNNEYIKRIHQMSYSSLSDNGMWQIFSFLVK